MKHAQNKKLFSILLIVMVCLSLLVVSMNLFLGSANMISEVQKINGTQKFATKDLLINELTPRLLYLINTTYYFSHDGSIKDIAITNDGLSLYVVTTSNLIKFGTNGTLLWNVSLNPTSDVNIEGVAVTRDDKFVYVVGYTGNLGYIEDLTIKLYKYNSSGALVWTKTWSTSYGGDVGYDIAVDSEGYVYVVGASWTLGAGSYFSLLLVKIDYEGNEVWNTTWSGLQASDYSVSDSYAYSIYISNNDIYITGTISGSDYYYSVVTLKYDTNGNLIWADVLKQQNTDNRDCGITIVKNGSFLYVLGKRSNSSGTFYFLLKYTIEGDFKWQIWINNVCRDITVLNKYVFVTGWFNYDIFISAYDMNGVLKHWVTWGTIDNEMSPLILSYANTNSIYEIGTISLASGFSLYIQLWSPDFDFDSLPTYLSLIHI